MSFNSGFNPPMIALLSINLIASILLTLLAKLILAKYFASDLKINTSQNYPKQKAKSPRYKTIFLRFKALRMNFGVAWGFYWFIFLICFFIPGLGEIISIFIVFSLYHQHAKFHEHIEILDNSINLLKIKPLNAEYGAGGGLLRLLDQKAPPENRTNALFKMAKLPLSQMNSMLYELLPDSSDELRLLAFNILDEQEGRMSQTISQLQTELLNDTNSETIKARLQKNLAQLYWDLVYQRLIIVELEKSMLEKAQSYAKNAAKVLTEDGTLWSLLGRIYSRLNQYQHAKQAFNKARALKAPAAKVIPYLAEIHFKNLDFIEVAKDLSSTPELQDITLMAEVKHFWNQDESF